MWNIRCRGFLLYKLQYSFVILLRQLKLHWMLDFLYLFNWVENASIYLWTSEKCVVLIVIIRWFKLVINIEVQPLVFRFINERFDYFIFHAFSCLFQRVKSPMGLTSRGDSIYPLTCDVNVVWSRTELQKHSKILRLRTIFDW